MLLTAGGEQELQRAFAALGRRGPVDSESRVSHVERMQHTLVLVDACDACSARAEDALFQHRLQSRIQGSSELNVGVVL